MEELIKKFKQTSISSPDDETEELKWYVENNAYTPDKINSIYKRYKRYLIYIKFDNNSEIELELKKNITMYINIRRQNHKCINEEYINYLLNLAVEIDNTLFEIISY